MSTTPTPQERPDLYDDYDLQDRQVSPAYTEQVLPDALKKMLAEHQQKRDSADVPIKSE